MPLKAATESRRLRLSLFTVLYFIQGIPSGLFLISLPGWFASNGLGKLEIGKFIAFTTLPWSFKFFFAPLMDRFHFLKMGRRRPWIITTQLGILVSTILMAAVPDPLNNLWWLSFYGFLMNLFSSIQDLAVDGMSVDVLPQEDRATAQGFMVGGQAIGRTLVSAGGALILFRFGYFNFIMLTGIIAGLGMLFPVFVRERPGEALLPWTEGRPSEHALKFKIDGWIPLVKNLFRAMAIPSSLILILALFVHRLPVGITRTVYPVVIVQKLGWTNQQFSQLLSLANLAAALFAMLLGPFIVAKIGRLKTIYVTFGLVVFVYLSSGFFTGYWNEKWFMAGSAILSEALMVLSNVAFFAILMELCGKKVAATQFALYMALHNFGISGGAWLCGILEKSFTETQFFYLCAFFSIATIAIMLLPNLKRDREKLAALDA